MMLSVLYNIVILPIETIVDFVFCFAHDHFYWLGVPFSIVAVSIAINILALPLYNIADSLQMKERDIQNKMSYRVKRIKAAFKGDERFMILNEYYRVNHYHPLYALRSALSILIEIPFFIAAYHFLSNCPALEGKTLGLIKDLSNPDTLLSIKLFSTKITINILPILMTLINFVSTFVYTKKASLREKLQGYILALLFLVILYNSPSGLVFYWILNNIFSLLKNIIQKMRNPKRILFLILSFLVVASCIILFLLTDYKFSKQKVLYYIFCMLFPFIPSFYRLILEKPFNKFITRLKLKQSFPVFILSCLTLWILAGLIVPSSVIASSTVEFSFLGNTDNPLSYILTASTFFFGLFVFWPTCIYKFFTGKTQKIMSISFFTVAICALLNVFLFKYNFGTISNVFSLDKAYVLNDYSFFYSVLPILCCLVVFIFYCFLSNKNKSSILSCILVILFLAESVLGLYKIYSISNDYLLYKEIYFANIEKAKLNKNRETVFHLSKTEKNVMILFFDRAISCFLPYIFNQFPELNDVYSGFTYYPNCISFGASTDISVPSFLGGYEYTPERINIRENEKLVDKHNEALCILPENFSKAGYRVVLSNPAWLNYKWDFDNTGFTDNPNISFIDLTTDNLTRQYIYAHQEDFDGIQPEDIAVRNNICTFTLMQIMYPPLRYTYYSDGTYSKSISDYAKKINNVRMDFVEAYASLYFLPSLIDFDSDKPGYMYFNNDSTHEYTALLAPDYRPGSVANGASIASTGNYKTITDPSRGDYNDFYAYHVNTSVLLHTAEFIRSLKEKGVYDNTRIIISSDHGLSIPLDHFEKIKKGFWEIAAFNPLYMVKDFNMTGSLKTDDTFMTIAETPIIATKDLPVSNVNPYTNEKFKSVSDFDVFHVYDVVGTEWDATELINKNKFTLLPENGYNIHTNVFDPLNWEHLDTIPDEETH